MALWGCGLDDYQHMFALSSAELTGRFLEYQGGISSFNAQLTTRGVACVSCSPLFQQGYALLESGEIAKQNAPCFDLFKADYQQGLAQHRYISADFPLPFADFFFDIAVSPHYIVSDNCPLTLEQQIEIIGELARVAKEVRLFPLIEANEKTPSSLGPLLLLLQQKKYGVEVKSVEKEGYSNAMLRVWAQQCVL